MINRERIFGFDFLADAEKALEALRSEEGIMVGPSKTPGEKNRGTKRTKRRRRRRKRDGRRGEHYLSKKVAVVATKAPKMTTA